MPGNDIVRNEMKKAVYQAVINYCSTVLSTGVLM